MEYQRLTLVVLNLLQLCRAQNNPTQWYSAKLIDADGFQPKPISEIFTTEPTFSTVNPIVVSEKTRSTFADDFNLLSSTLAPPTSQFESTTNTQKRFPSTSVPAGVLYQQTQPERLNQYQVDYLPQQQEAFLPQVHQFPVEQQLQYVTEIPQFNLGPFQPQTEKTITQGLPQTTLFNPQTQPTSSSQLPPSVVTSSSTSLPPARQPNSNYFLIYQQGAQANPIFRPFPPSPTPVSEITIRETLPTTVNLPPRNEATLFTAQTFPITSISTTTPLPTTLSSTTPFPTTWLSTTPRPTTWLSTTPLSTLLSSRVTVTPSSTLGLSYAGSNTSTTALPILLPRGFTTKKGIAFPIKIRVVAPTGSITNVNINPLTTTKRPTTRRCKTRKTTTTRKPTTQKPKKNNYDRCLDGCRKVKDPICAAPLSHHEIDPKTLRGFPSVCHMACHNSYRNQPFENVMEGSCSKLRTRIRLLDSRNKLKRGELQKNEYSVDQRTIIEVNGLA